MYLEKIAASPGLFTRAFKSGVKTVGTTLNRAIGGTHRSYAISKGITDPIVLSRINGSEEGIAALHKALGSNTNKFPHRAVKLTDSIRTRAIKNRINFREGGRDQRKFINRDNEILQKQTRNARIATAAVAGGSYLGYQAIKNKISEKQNQSAYQYTY
jgi:hypothetical protein